MEEVVGLLNAALDKVAANRGAPGPDGRSIEHVRKHWPTLLPKLGAALLDGSYRPGEIRRVWIPKAGGGERGLGIPNVVDRVVQEAVRAVIAPLYEPTFHPSSHGFRPNRSCHTAIAEATRHVGEGFEWVVDIDLEKFFDRVHHQRLMARLAMRVPDKRLLALVGAMLKAQVVMPDGVRVSTEEGVPQGGPLSPLLSNIVLSELDEELARRGHRFVRYADDCNIYVRSERAGQRVMESVTSFIERRLRLKVNAAKSAVARPQTRHFLGFRLLPRSGGEPEVLLSERSKKRLRQRVRELTPRNRGRSLDATIREINAYLEGWLGFFGVCSLGVRRVLQAVDAHIRRRLRAIVLRHWKTKRTIVRRLANLGVRSRTARKRVYEGRKSVWALSHVPVVERALRNAYFAERGLVSLLDRMTYTWADRSAPAQLSLALGTERS
jgi:group II intron reverse transcriptase/maturase